jgi:zinc protease
MRALGKLPRRSGSWPNLGPNLVPNLALAALLWAAPAFAAPWPVSDIPHDPAVRFGVLPNGMRYVILKNQTPANAVSVRFSIDVGSTDESAGQRGFSHFVEHMAFRGSKNFPDGELNRSLERLGLRFGADTNASTGQYRTEFRFDLPNAKNTGEALAIARDVAGNVSFDPGAVETEAGVVMSEAAMREGPGHRAGLKELQFVLADTRAAATPGSEPDIVQKPAVSDLQRFYRAWYRPERAILTVVGDIDPDALASDIAARFADWNAAGPEAARPVFQVPFRRGLEAQIYVEEGAPNELTLYWVRPPRAHPVNRGAWKRFHIHSVAFQIINRRLSAMASSSGHPFINARGGELEAFRAADMVSLSAGFESGAWNKALGALAQTRLALLKSSVSQAEIDSVVTAQKAEARRQEAAADTRTTQGLAGNLAGTTALDEMPFSPAQIRAVIDEDLAGLTPEIVGQARKEMLDGDPLIFLSSRSPLSESEAAILQAYRAVTDDTEPAASGAAVPWPYTDFGARGRVVESRKVSDIGVTRILFANNVRLLVRPSRLRLNQVLVSVKFGDGRLGLPKDRAVAHWLLGGAASGGLGALSSSQIVTALSGKSYGLGLGLSDGYFSLGGGTSSQDLPTQLELLTAFIKDPGFRPDAFEQFRQQSIGRLRSADATPQGMMGLKSAEILHDGDKRWATPSLEEMRAASAVELKTLLAPLMARGPIEVVITGDTSVEEATRAVARTLGALPVRAGHHLARTRDNDTVFPAAAAAPVVLKPSAPSPQILASASWATGSLFADLPGDASVQLLTALLREKLLDDLRGHGLSYSVQVSAPYSVTFDYGTVSVAATMPSGRAQTFYDAVDKAAAELKAGKIGADEFARVRTPALESFRRSVQTNDYWQDLLISGWDENAKFNRARNFEHALESVTAEDVIAAAKKYLSPGRMVRISAGS